MNIVAGNLDPSVFMDPGFRRDDGQPPYPEAPVYDMFRSGSLKWWMIGIGRNAGREGKFSHPMEA
ncbi:MAG TPA: hypothetical protein VFP12_11410 [Allosphingosinicella sp.]|nr:hypothetical protein [Allosphingosinicella sp.]